MKYYTISFIIKPSYLYTYFNNAHYYSTIYVLNILFKIMYKIMKLFWGEGDWRESFSGG